MRRNDKAPASLVATGAADGVKAWAGNPTAFEFTITRGGRLVNVAHAFRCVHGGVNAAIWLDEQGVYHLEPSTRVALCFVRDALARAGLAAERRQDQ